MFALHVCLYAFEVLSPVDIGVAEIAVSIPRPANQFVEVSKLMRGDSERGEGGQRQRQPARDGREPGAAEPYRRNTGCNHEQKWIDRQNVAEPNIDSADR